MVFVMNQEPMLKLNFLEEMAASNSRTLEAVKIHFIKSIRTSFTWSSSKSYLRPVLLSLHILGYWVGSTKKIIDFSSCAVTYCKGHIIRNLFLALNTFVKVTSDGMNLMVIWSKVWTLWLLMFWPIIKAFWNSGQNTFN